MKERALKLPNHNNIGGEIDKTSKIFNIPTAL